METGGKKRKTKKTRDETTKAAVVCLTCRSLKKKCDGQVPCARCVEKGCADSCQQVVPRKRGRRSRSELAAEAAAMAAAAAAGQSRPVAPMGAEPQAAWLTTPLRTGVVTDMVLPTSQATLLALLMEYSGEALAERPWDLLSAFGLGGLDQGYLSFAVPSRRDFPDALSCFMRASIVGGAARHAGQLMDLGQLKGRLLQEVSSACMDPRQMQEITHVLTAPPPVSGRPWIRRFRHRKLIMTHFNTVDDLLLEDTLFMDPETSMPRWVMCVVVECLSSTEAPPALAHLRPLQVVGEEERAEALRPEQCAEHAAAAAEAAAAHCAAEEGSTSSDLAEPLGARQDFLLAAGRSGEQLFGRSALLRSADMALPLDGWMGAADLCSPEGPRLGASADGLRFDFLEAI